MTRRLFVPEPPDDDRLRFGGGALRHLHTLRLRPGARLIVFDGRGTEHEVRLARVGAREAEGTVLATRPGARESSLDLVLAPALLKGPKMDVVVEKATELGVHRIAPFVSRHVVARGARVDRWRRIAIAACEQSGRATVPIVDAPRSLTALLALPWPGLRLLAWEHESRCRLADLPATVHAVVAVVGPEGGFARDEVARAREHQFTAVGLAPRILRAETAALAVVSLCQHRWGDLG